MHLIQSNSNLGYAAIAQLVERIHGKDEVSGSTPDRGSTLLLQTNVKSSRSFFVYIFMQPVRMHTVLIRYVQAGDFDNR